MIFLTVMSGILQNKKNKKNPIISERGQSKADRAENFPDNGRTARLCDGHDCQQKIQVTND
jgi:hypothetical protein